jgi:hypothetical protein
MEKYLTGDKVIIGIQGVPEWENPTSGIFINDLPGVNVELASKIADVDTLTGVDVLKRKIIQGIRYVIDNFNAEAWPYTFVDTTDTANPKFENTPGVPAGNIGFEITSETSEYGIMVLKGFELRALEGGDYTYSVLEGEEETVISSGSIDAYPGNFEAHKEETNIKTAHGKLKVLIAATGTITPLIGDLKKTRFCQTCSRKKTKRSNLRISGIADDILHTEIRGASPIVQSGCDKDRFNSQIVETMSRPIFYRAGIEIVNEALYSRRLNDVVTFYEDELEGMLKTLQKEYDRAYETFLRSIQTLMKSKHDECLQYRGHNLIHSTP